MHQNIGLQYFNGDPMFTTWCDHQPDLKTDAFRKEFNTAVSVLRMGVLKDYDSMMNFCRHFPESRMDGSTANQYVFRLESERYEYILRLNEDNTDYSYIYCYDKEEQKTDYNNKTLRECLRAELPKTYYLGSENGKSLIEVSGMTADDIPQKVQDLFPDVMDAAVIAQADEYRGVDFLLKGITGARLRDFEDACDRAMEEAAELRRRQPIRVVKVEPGKPAYEDQMANTLEAEQEYVQGLIECVGLGDAILICNDEAKLMDMEPNRHVNGQVISGPFFLAGNSADGDFSSLTDKQVAYYLQQFAQPEKISMQEARADMGFRIISW